MAAAVPSVLRSRRPDEARLARVLAVLLTGLALVAEAQLPSYEVQPGIAGDISSVGSDTLAGLMTRWSERFRELQPDVNIQVQAGGSATAPPALAEGVSTIGPMSRKMRRAEIEAFRERYGYAPLEVPLAIDAIAILVHRDNPLRAIALSQLDRIFSANALCAAGMPLMRWSEVLPEEAPATLRSLPVQPVGRNAASGTYGFFREQVLCGGDYQSRMYELPGSASVVQAVAMDRRAIGYASIGFRNASVRVLPVAGADGAAVAPTRKTIVDRRYPLARTLFAYVNRAPGRPLPQPERAFLDFVLSAPGQAEVPAQGYLSLPEDLVRATRKILGLDEAGGAQ